jgi:hypothetical protein
MTIVQKEKTHLLFMRGRHDGLNKLHIIDNNNDETLGRYTAYNVYALSEALVMYELHEDFNF